MLSDDEEKVCQSRDCSGCSQYLFKCAEIVHGVVSNSIEIWVFFFYDSNVREV